MINEDDNINELDNLFDDKIEEKSEEPAKEEHPLGEEDWVERRKNPHGRRKDDKDKLLATKILLFMVIIMIIITAGILGIELELKKELEESINTSSYNYSVQKFETNQKRMEEKETARQEENEAEESENKEETPENTTSEDTNNETEESTENNVEE